MYIFKIQNYNEQKTNSYENQHDLIQEEKQNKIDDDEDLIIHNFTPQEDRILESLCQSPSQGIDWNIIATYFKVKTKSQIKLDPMIIKRRWEQKFNPAAKRRRQRQERQLKTKQQQRQIMMIIQLAIEHGINYDYIASRFQNRKGKEIFLIIKNILKEAIKALQNLIRYKINDPIYPIHTSQMDKLIQHLTLKKNNLNANITDCRKTLFYTYGRLRKGQDISNADIIEYYTILNNFMVEKNLAKKWVSRTTNPDKLYSWSYTEQKKISNMFNQKQGKLDQIYKQFEQQRKQNQQKYSFQVIKSKICSMLQSGIKLVSLIAKQKYFYSPTKWQIQNKDFIIKKFVSGQIQDEKRFRYVKRLMSLNFDQVIKRQDIDKMLKYLASVVDQGKKKFNGQNIQQQNGK